jgi:hypothetical protein
MKQVCRLCICKEPSISNNKNTKLLMMLHYIDILLILSDIFVFSQPGRQFNNQKDTTDSQNNQIDASDNKLKDTTDSQNNYHTITMNNSLRSILKKSTSASKLERAHSTGDLKGEFLTSCRACKSR